MNRRLLVLLGAVLLPTTTSATEGLARCAKLENVDERIACYDELARATQAPSGRPIEASPTPSHLSEAWKLGAKHGDARRLTDILGYRPTYIISRWTSDPNEQPASPAPGGDLARAAGSRSQRDQVPDQLEGGARFALRLRPDRRHAASRSHRHRQRALVVRLYAPRELADVQHRGFAPLPGNQLRARGDPHLRHRQ